MYASTLGLFGSLNHRTTSLLDSNQPDNYQNQFLIKIGSQHGTRCTDNSEMEPVVYLYVRMHNQEYFFNNLHPIT